MHIELTCNKCGEHLESTADFLNTNAIEFKIDPCTSFECTQERPLEEKDLYPELEPLIMPYETLMRILGKKEVVVTYRKKNGDLRELTGHLGRSDACAVPGNLAYFHEIVAGQEMSKMSKLYKPKTDVKCLLVRQIKSVVLYEDGQRTVYGVLEAQ
jgi:hypothetical protein